LEAASLVFGFVVKARIKVLNNSANFTPSDSYQTIELYAPVNLRGDIFRIEWKKSGHPPSNHRGADLPDTLQSLPFI
jgi:hypothetical protein